MLIDLVVIGRLKDRAMQARCDEFGKWLRKYAKVEVTELPDSTVEREGEAILKVLERERHALTVGLTEEGREFSSTAFAEFLGKSERKLIFVIGGPYGLAPAVKARCEVLWSLSRLTFTHELARLLLYEQLYRACNILQGGNYHNP